MLKQKIVYLKLVFLSGILLFSWVQISLATDFKVSPFALYEQGQENIYIEGVRTKYGLGVVGVAVETQVSTDFKIGTRLGYGYHPNARVSLSVESREVAVTGPVSGVYLEGSISYLHWDRSNYSLMSNLRFISRNVDASKLVGTAGSRAITGNAVNDFDTLDLVSSFQIPVGESAFLNISAGLSQWNLKTTAVAYAQTGSSGSFSCPCSFTKRIDTTSIDPVGGISISNRNPRHRLDLELYGRSLQSKAGTQIIGLEIEYKYNF